MPSGLRGGTYTNWREWGDAPEVALIHCTLAHSGAWKGLAALLNRGCVAFDLPGHGRSGSQDETQDYQVQSLNVAQDFVRPGMDLIGHSFGATVALRLVVENPGLVRRLVLIEPVFFAAAKGTPEFKQQLEDVHPFAEAFKAGNLEHAAQLFTDVWGGGAAWSDLREDQRAGMIAQIHLVVAQNAAIYEDNAGLLVPGRLDGVTCPVLLIDGAQSPPIIDAINTSLANRITHSFRASIAGASHMVPITHPAKVANVITQFWAENP